jgi:hypothetical protein
VAQVKGYRTIALNAAMALISVTDYLTNGAVLGSFITDPKQLGLVVLLVNVANIVLRSLTSTPVGKKE